MVTLVLFIVSAGTTLATWTGGLVADWIWELCMCLLGAFVVVTFKPPRPQHWAETGLPAAALLSIGTWGFVQLLLGGSVYRWATLNCGLRLLALASCCTVSWLGVTGERMQRWFLAALVWFGFAVACLAVLTCITSVQKVFWYFPAPYPDVWGPFLSRNNLAQFLELVLPVAVVMAFERRGQAGADVRYLAMAAAILAAGFASASRSGAVLLATETCVVMAILWLRTPTRDFRAGLIKGLRQFLIAAVVFGAWAGAASVWTRIHKSDPLEYRREIYGSALAMVRSRPWTGTGLGTFARVYPAYASFDSGAEVGHAHSDWLEWAAEGGLGFAGAWMALAIVLVRPAMRTLWGTGILAVFIHAMVDDPFVRPGVAGWLMALAGLLLQAGGEKTRTPRLPAAVGKSSPG